MFSDGRSHSVWDCCRHFRLKKTLYLYWVCWFRPIPIVGTSRECFDNRYCDYKRSYSISSYSLNIALATAGVLHFWLVRQDLRSRVFEQEGRPIDLRRPIPPLTFLQHGPRFWGKEGVECGGHRKPETTFRSTTLSKSRR